MAPIGNTVLSHVDGVSDSARARELYRYYQPAGPVNQENCFPVQEDGSTLTDDPVRPVTGTDGVRVLSDVVSSKVSSPDTALTAFCQLVTWRIGAQRAMISLIDAETQYFIAESTKTVDLVDNTKHAPGDEIWMGCGSVTKAGRLCERTLEAKPTEKTDIYPSFIVNDLRADDRFNELPFVTGPPYMKFYAGVPLVTVRGIPIGSLFVVDDRVWNGLSTADVNFMGTMSETIMRHLEMTREVEQHRRGMKMSRGLASFVEGRVELAEADAEAEEGEGTVVAGSFETEPSVAKSISRPASVKSIAPSIRSVERKEKEYSFNIIKSETDLMDSMMESNTASSVRPSLHENAESFGSLNASIPSPQFEEKKTAISPDDNSESTTLHMLFSRAANLIREAFEVDGGVVFYDAQKGTARSSFGHGGKVESSLADDSARESQTSGDEYTTCGETTNEFEGNASTPQISPRFQLGASAQGSFSRSSKEGKSPAELLGFSTSSVSSVHGDRSPTTHSLKPIDNKTLSALLKRYARGKLWTFDSDGAASSSSEEEVFRQGRKGYPPHAKDYVRDRTRTTKDKRDARILSRFFPGVRQLLFVPLWDAGKSRWMSGCFLWSTEETRVLSRQSELYFLSAFCNSVMAECSRIDTEIADQKKGDFIGSISHELRSPLHGILASAEFLGEESLNSFEMGLVETIDSCGRTLLDTINHILDFSKINQFEKVWRKNKRGSRSAGRGPMSLKKTDLPMVNLFAEVDVSIVCEEVVEGVFAGYVFQNMTAGNFDIVPAPRDKMKGPDVVKSLTTSIVQPTDEGQIAQSEVQVVFDVNMHSYNFVTQPGAFRRVIMNLLGNALKYTSHGYVFLKLVVESMSPLNKPATGETVERSMVTITIKDTGRGISAEFLRSKIFTPFAQENSLSSGTGLGLSIVRSIISLLEGEITIDSEVGKGTEIRVMLPLLHDMPKSGDTPSSSNRSATSGPRETDETIRQLRAYVAGHKASLHGFDVETADPVIKEMYALLKESVTNFLVNWYGMKIVPQGSRTNLIIANEASPFTITKLTSQASMSHRKNPTILVLCSQNARMKRDNTAGDSKTKVGYVAKPVGPLKLAKAIMQCLDGATPMMTPGVPEQPYTSPPTQSNDLSNIFEELSFKHNNELLDNSRMAADTENARKAIESPTPTHSEKHAEFPFPMSSPEHRPKATSAPTSNLDLSNITNRRTSIHERPASQTLTALEQQPPFPRLTKPIPATSSERQYAPTMLLVDDNKINLRLLKTYMLKKKYPIIDEAENGLEAVNKFAAREGGYDIIFMDISMPILDGFGATKQIRSIERSRRRTLSTSSPLQSSQQSEDHVSSNRKGETLVIALTGLASGSDQQEAANVGIDIFLTKPVSFKEVGRLLDNWEANRERESRGESS